ncbi:hypothetical protein [Acinetobacter baumannii]
MKLNHNFLSRFVFCLHRIFLAAACFALAAGKQSWSTEQRARYAQE